MADKVHGTEDGKRLEGWLVLGVVNCLDTVLCAILFEEISAVMMTSGSRMEVGATYVSRAVSMYPLAIASESTRNNANVFLGLDIQ